MNFLSKGHNILLSYILTTNPTFLFTQKNEPNCRVYKFQLILMKFPKLNLIWTEGKNLSLPDLLSRSLTTTRQDEHNLRTVEIADLIKLFSTHNSQTQPTQCHYAV